MRITKAVVLMICIGLGAVAISSVADSYNQQGLALQVTKVAKSVSERQTLTVQGEIYQATPPEPVVTTQGPRQGGDRMDNATVISSMPYNDVGTTDTALYEDDYEELCGSNAANMPDVVYTYTPDIDELVDISLCNSSYATRLWVYDVDTNLIDCNRFNTEYCSEPRSYLAEVPMDSGMQYFIIVDGDWQITPGFGDYEINCTSIPAPQPTDSVNVHPGLAYNGGDSLMLSYTFNNGLDSQVFWSPSLDGGMTFEPPVYITQNGLADYSAVDFWGEDTIFYGTYVPPSTDNAGGNTQLLQIYNVADNATWQPVYWNWASYGWHDMRMADIACNDDFIFSDTLPGDHRFGIITMVHSSTYPLPDYDLIDGPHLFYQTDSANYATISWYQGLNGCNSTTCDIDDVTHFSYAVYDILDTTNNDWGMFFRRDVFGDPDDTLLSGGYTYLLDPGNNVQHPVVAANDGHMLTVTEYFEDATPDQHDLIVWYDPDTLGSLENLVTTVVVATADDERFPRLQHVSGSKFLCTYVVNNTLMMTLTEDGGLTWGTPEMISQAGDHVVSEYRSADISEDAAWIIYEYQPFLPDDSSIFLRLVATDLVQDVDGDGVEDDVDNCIDIPNPSQEDADLDGIGDSCDTCTDTDGDGYGDPGFPANTCELDNCPDDPNPGQEDTNDDGIGDACCCEGERGNIDGIESVPGFPITIDDITYLVDYIFGNPTGPEPPCPDEGNVDGIESVPGFPVTIDDVTYLVDFIFGNPAGPPPPACP